MVATNFSDNMFVTAQVEYHTLWPSPIAAILLIVINPPLLESFSGLPEFLIE